MPVYHQHKSIFIHIPKSAGSTIHSILSNSEEYSDHQKLDIDSVTKKYYKFAFVRNPWDRFLSTYIYFKGYGRDKRGDVTMGKIVNRYSTFKTFTLNFHKIDTSEWIYPHWNEQLYWIDKRLDFVGRFENLQQDMNTICDKIGIAQQQLPHNNKSNHKHYTEYYDDETKQIVAQKYAKDIEYFGYEFGE